MRDFFSEGPASPPSLPSVSSSSAADPGKLLSLLETTESNIMMMFGVGSSASVHVPYTYMYNVHVAYVHSLLMKANELETSFLILAPP